MRNSHILGFKECVALPQVLHSFAVNLEFDCAGRNIADYRARMTVRSACLARRELDSLDFDMLNQFGGANNVNIMLKVDKGDIFNKEVLKKIYDMTQAMDRINGVNHDQIASIGHRTTRYLTVLGGTIATPPVMRRPPKSEEEVEEIKKICYNSDAIYGQLVALNGQAALIKVNFIEGRLDYRRIFDEINRTVIEPFENDQHTIWVAGEPRLYGWIYHYANEVFTVFILATLFCWVLLYLYFQDWRGALRPTITGVTSALWGMGTQAMMGSPWTLWPW